MEFFRKIRFVGIPELSGQSANDPIADVQITLFGFQVWLASTAKMRNPRLGPISHAKDRYLQENYRPSPTRANGAQTAGWAASSAGLLRISRITACSASARACPS